MAGKCQNQEDEGRTTVRAWASTAHASQPGYLSIEHAAAWADVHPRTVKRWIKAGLPTYQAGPRTKVLIKPSDIDGFLTKHRTPTLDLDKLVEDVLVDLQKSSNN